MATYKGYSSVGRDYLDTAISDTTLIRADLLNHFNTRLGERVMNPEFGCLVWNYLFDPFTADAKFAVIENLQEIVKQDPRVVLRSLDVVEYEHGLQVDLDLVYADSDQTEYMRVAFDQRTNSAEQI
jgi:phage baseplate assembly protein W